MQSFKYKPWICHEKDAAACLETSTSTFMNPFYCEFRLSCNFNWPAPFKSRRTGTVCIREDPTNNIQGVEAHSWRYVPVLTIGCFIKY